MTQPPDDVSSSQAELLAEDIADLTARIDGLASALTELRRSITELNDPPPLPDPGPVADHKSGFEPLPPAEPGAQEGHEQAAPSFIPYLTGADHRAELDRLAQWIHEILVPNYLGEPSQQHRWCAQWWTHPEAVARLHALWMAWQELTDPDAGGYTGPSLWHRDHLDAALPRLQDIDGPFAGCSADPARPNHLLPPSVLSTPPP